MSKLQTRTRFFIKKNLISHEKSGFNQDKSSNNQFISIFLDIYHLLDEDYE